MTEAYNRACAVTQEHSLPALEAAHIRPFAKEGPHEVRNGLLLRADLHRLFEQGYLTVTPNYTLEVSDRLRHDYQNGRSYYPLRGTRISVPAAGDRATDSTISSRGTIRTSFCNRTRDGARNTGSQHESGVIAVLVRRFDCGVLRHRAHEAILGELTLNSSDSTVIPTDTAAWLTEIEFLQIEARAI